MGFLDGLLGRKKMVGPAPDRLFALTTAYVTLETGHQITTSGKAAIVFQPIEGQVQYKTADITPVFW